MSMKKNLLFSMLVALLILVTINVKAASSCSDTREAELSGLANNVNVDYDIYDKVLEDSTTNGQLEEGDVATEPAIMLRIYNLTKDLKVKVQQEGTTTAYVYTISDVQDDGILYLDSSFANAIITYDITIISADSNCLNEVLRTTSITLPEWNLYSDIAACNGYEDFYLCNEFTTTDYSNVNGQQFYTELEAYKAEKTKEENSITRKVANFFDTYKWYIIGVVIIALGITTYIIIRNRNKRKAL